MSRRNYIHKMDALIGRPLYSNAIGEAPINSTGVVFSESGATTSNPPTNTGVVIGGTTTTTTSGSTGGTTSSGATATSSKNVMLSKSDLTATATTAPSKNVDSVAPIVLTKQPETTNTTVVVTPSYPPLTMGGGYGGGGGGISGLPSSKVVAPKPNFIKKNIVPILLVGSAIYLITKKPI